MHSPLLLKGRDCRYISTPASTPSNPTSCPSHGCRYQSGLAVLVGVIRIQFRTHQLQPRSKTPETRSLNTKPLRPLKDNAHSARGLVEQRPRHRRQRRQSVPSNFTRRRSPRPARRRPDLRALLRAVRVRQHRLLRGQTKPQPTPQRIPSP